MTSDGKGLAKIEGWVVFIKGAVPGDVVNARVFKKKKNLLEASIVSVEKSSEGRIEPVCKHFGVCGGCKWQNLSYQSQIEFKEKHVKDAIERIGKIAYGEFRPILGNKVPYFYRNKLEYTFSNKRWLTAEELGNKDELNTNGIGFHIPGLFDKVIDIEECHLQNEASNAIRNAIREYAFRNKLTFFDIRGKSGMLRTLMIRTTSTGELMVVISMFENKPKEIKDLCKYLIEAFPQITSLQYVHNPKGNDTLTDLEIHVYHGDSYITEKMEDLQFRISTKSFYQTNSLQAYELYKIVRDFAGLSKDMVVYDLYTGTGTIANFVASQCNKVIGVEYVEAAIEDAKVNSEINNIGNTLFFAGDMKEVFTPDFVKANGHPDVVITDPPRAGMDPEVIKVIMDLQPKKIVYVSCNPSTQGRDLELLKERYNLQVVQPVDMFPQTSHVENVTLLTLKGL
ncbi:MAG: 23S rRNA (uracil(1939)-C(5))-methyltransferase RlmD [Bacteroidia bacterium]